jgi:hypothetical protein
MTKQTRKELKKKDLADALRANLERRKAAPSKKKELKK